MDTFRKTPNASLDWVFDWTSWLAGDTIEQSTITVPDGLTKGDDEHDNTTAQVWLSGGTLGQTYKVTNRIVTSQNRTDERSMRLHIADR